MEFELVIDPSVVALGVLVVYLVLVGIAKIAAGFAGFEFNRKCGATDAVSGVIILLLVAIYVFG